MNYANLKELTIATRKSPLALWQANFVAAKLKELLPNAEIRLLPMLTKGDKTSSQNWLQQNGKDMFVKELEEALLTKKADLAVHSMKDLGVTLKNGLTLAAILSRANPFDALVSNKYPALLSLPKGAKIGTASLRRKAQLLQFRSDFNVQTLRGNLQTRLKKMADEDFDGIILAVAGLERLNLSALIREKINPNIMLPACGQGALGIECRADNSHLLTLLAKLNSANSSLCVLTERRINAKLGGNCHTPIGIYCAIANDTLHINTKVLSQDGKHCIAVNLSGLPKDAFKLADKCALELFNKGASDLLTTDN
ncbi:MAG: hydroxymethylbilane synthase [Legionellales bacterium RIFCSPHIGHO2_12_FULL_37_14]|nr:MAG: hydroxymethylbilane synthase [Legionellales bacterium RIFCSPHIGHO2_12_FULL_37_14]